MKSGMKTSRDRILTTHVGSLPRPEDLLSLIEASESGRPHDPDALVAREASAVAEIVAQQVANGVDIVGDGEMSKISYTFYVRHRLSGIGTAAGAGKELPKTGAHQDLLEHPDYHERLLSARGAGTWFTRQTVPVCTGPVTYANPEHVARDLRHLRAAVDVAHAFDAFVSAASPGVLTKFVPDLYYEDEDAYIGALADAMSVEYEAIVAAGFVLQIDSPDLGSARHNQYAHLSDAEFLRIAGRNIAALNHATRNIPSDAMRMHVCWGNYEGPHTHDIPLAVTLPSILRARPSGLLFEGANPRHAHEWEDLKAAKIPDDKILIPGLIDSTSNFVEHPRLIAQRIGHYADIVGRERVIGGTDCGFATFAGPNNAVAPSVVWAKLKALAEGAEIASARLWA